MTRRSLAQHLSAWLLLPAMLMLGLTSTYQLFRCRYDGVVRRSCCCPMDGSEANGTSLARVSDSSCCDVQVVRATTAPASAPAQQHAAKSIIAPVALLPVATFALPSLVHSQTWSDEVPRGLGPPLIIQKHSFLI